MPHLLAHLADEVVPRAEPCQDRSGAGDVVTVQDAQSRGVEVAARARQGELFAEALEVHPRRIERGQVMNELIDLKSHPRPSFSRADCDGFDRLAVYVVRGPHSNLSAQFATAVTGLHVY
jgi:hypothetical protein